MNARCRSAPQRGTKKNATPDHGQRRIKPHGAILDVGCGNGMLGEFLSKDEFNVTGIDIADAMVALAKGRLRGAVQGDAEHLPFPDASFDIVFARSLLHHLPHPGEGVKEIARVLRPGGRMIATDPIKTPLSMFPRKLMYAKSDHFSDEHKNFEPQELMNYISSALTVTHAERFGYIAYPLLGFPDLCSIYRYMPAKALATPWFIALDRVIARISISQSSRLGHDCCCNKTMKIVMHALS